MVTGRCAGRQFSPLIIAGGVALVASLGGLLLDDGVKLGEEAVEKVRSERGSSSHLCVLACWQQLRHRVRRQPSPTHYYIEQENPGSNRVATLLIFAELSIADTAS